MSKSDEWIEEARALVEEAGRRIRLDHETKQAMRERAIELAERAYGETDSDAARLALAAALIDHPTRGEEAVPHVRALVARDVAEAHCLLGWLLYRGQGVAKDEVASRRHHRLAAERGVADAQFEMSIYLDKGVGGATDSGEARRWEALAAAQGHGRACLNVASWAATGTHGEIDMARAVEYYERAAKAGYADAAMRLAVMYAMGTEVEEDPEKALAWRAEAEALGLDGDAVDALLDDAGASYGAGAAGTAEERLHGAILAEDLDEVKAAIAAGADVEAPDSLDRTPLMAAASDGVLEIVRALLDAGADPNHYRVEVMFVAVLDTPLERARAGKHRKVVKLLKERGAKETKDLPDPQALVVDASGTPDERLTAALWEEDVERVKKALADGANPKGHLSHGDEPFLAAAVRLGKPAYVKLLLDAGADPDVRSEGKKGRPLLHDWFQGAAGLACFELLLAAGANPNVAYEKQSVAGYLPDDRTLKARMIRTLLDHGYEVDRKDSAGFTLLATVVQEGADLELFELLVAKGANVKAKIGGLTLAEHAKYSSGKAGKKMMKRLIELGAKAPD
jgi:TPR repeat protein/ankyrin repeat protein